MTSRRRSRHRRHKQEAELRGYRKRIAALEVFLVNLFQSAEASRSATLRMRRELERNQLYIARLQHRLELDVCRQIRAEVESLFP